MMLEDIYNYLKLSEEISTSGQPTEEQIAEIGRAGFQIVINLALHGVEYSLPDEGTTVKSHGMSYIHIPVIWEQPRRADLLAFLDAMEQNKGRKIFVHCAANMRVSAFMALYRILRLDWDRQAAFGDMQRIWTPNETWQSFIDEMLGDSL